MYLVDSLLFTFGLYQLQHSEPKYYAAKGVIEMVLSVLLIKGMPPFVDLAFPPDEPSTLGKSGEDTKHDS